MPDFKPLPKPIDTKKPVRRTEDDKPPARAVKSKTGQHKLSQTRAVSRPYVSKRKSGPIAPDPSQPYQPKYAKPKEAKSLQKKASKVCHFIRKKRLVGITAAFVLTVSLISLFIWSLTGNNAFAIYLDDHPIGYIAFSQEINADILRAGVTSRLEIIENARISLNEEISLRPARTASRNILPFHDSIEQLANALTFQIVGTAIEVNGSRVAILRTQADAEEVIRQLKSPFLQESRDYHTVEFLENLELINISVEESDLSTVEYARRRLDVRVPVLEEYVVQEGDTLGAIALRHGTTLARLYEDNPALSPTDFIRVGDVIVIQSYRPHLSVRTVEAVTRIDPIPIENQYLDNPGLASGTRQIIQEGSEGQREVVIHITRINGVQTEEQIVAERILENATPNIIEIGSM